MISLLQFFGRYVRRYASWATLAVVTIPVFAIASTAMVSLIEPIFGEVLQAGQDSRGMFSMGDAPGAAGVDAWWDIKGWMTSGYLAVKSFFGIEGDAVVWFVPTLFIGVFVVRGAAGFISSYAMQRIGLGVTTDVRNDLFRRLLDQSASFHSRHSSGELISRTVADIEMMQMAVSTHLLNLLQQAMTLVLLLGLLYTTNLKLALICSIGAPVVLYPIFRFGRSMRRVSHRTQERLADLTSVMNESIRGHRVVQAYGMETHESGRFEKATKRHLGVNLKAQLLATMSSPVIETLSALGSAAFLIYAGYALRRSELTAPEVIQFLFNMLLLYEPIRRLNRVNLILQRATASALRVVDMIGRPIEIVDLPDALPMPPVRQGLRFDDIHFAYEKDPVLRGVSFEIGVGEMVALVGASGAGKTTLANLVPRFYDPDRGAVLIDGVDIRNLPVMDVRRAIGLVTQETILFDETVARNLAYGREDISRERLEAAATAAYADEFIGRLPDGYDTRVGEAGSRLSGGERQRLAIARALLKNAPILILDEATSQLDSQSEALVQKALANLMQGRTTLVIAHRLATVQRADRIVVLEAGRIVETGTHGSLLARDGVYRKLYEMQFAEART